MRICVFGGAFDPLHLGHEGIIEKLLLRFEKVVVMPSKVSLGKKPPMASELDRLKMLSLCSFVAKDNLVIDNYELKSKEEYSFTIDSISYIKNKFKEDDIYIALGFDQFKNLSNWRESETLLSMVKIICFNRSGLTDNILVERCEIVEDFNYDISSSEIKDLVKTDFFKIKDMVNENIFNYIMEHNLYR